MRRPSVVVVVFVLVLVVLVVLGAACSSDPSTPSIDAAAQVDSGMSHVDGAAVDGPEPDASLCALTCNQIAGRASALVATLDRTCVTVADCAVLGGTMDCDCAPSFSTLGSGVAISKTSAMNAELTGLATEFAARCQHAACSSDNTCQCDAAPAKVTCEGGVCVTEQQSCIGLTFDAPPSPDAP